MKRNNLPWWVYLIVLILTWIIGYLLATYVIPSPFSGSVNIAYAAQADEAPHCEIVAETGDIVNRVVFDISWSNGNGWPFQFEFGDNAETTIGESNNGQTTTSHDYDYVVGGVTEPFVAAMYLSGGDQPTCTTQFVIDDRPEEPEASIEVVSQVANHVEFRLVWSGGRSDVAHRLDFGDSSPNFEVVGESGEQVVTHDYAWDTGVTWATLTVIGYDKEVTKAVEVTIVDPNKVYTIYMPGIFTPASQPPSCTITAEVGDIVNRINFTVTWANGTEIDRSQAVYPLKFGDGSETYLFGGSNGTATASHDYAYVPGGTKTYVAAIHMGSDVPTCQINVVIDDTH